MSTGLGSILDSTKSAAKNLNVAQPSNKGPVATASAIPQWLIGAVIVGAVGLFVFLFFRVVSKGAATA